MGGSFILLIPMFFNTPDVREVTLLSLKVSCLATAISLLIGLPVGTGLARGRFPGRNLLLSIVKK
jgi:tungstate transport system permease protein